MYFVSDILRYDVVCNRIDLQVCCEIFTAHGPSLMLFPLLGGNWMFSLMHCDVKQLVLMHSWHILLLAYIFRTLQTPEDAAL